MYAHVAICVPCCGLVLRLVLFSIWSWARLCLWLRFKLRSALFDPRWLELSVEVLSLVVSRIVRGSEDSLREGQEVDNLWLFDFWLELISRLAWALLIRISWMRSWIREICKILSSEKELKNYVKSFLSNLTSAKKAQ